MNFQSQEKLVSVASAHSVQTRTRTATKPRYCKNRSGEKRRSVAVPMQSGKMFNLRFHNSVVQCFRTDGFQHLTLTKVMGLPTLR